MPRIRSRPLRRLLDAAALSTLGVSLCCAAQLSLGCAVASTSPPPASAVPATRAEMFATTSGGAPTPTAGAYASPYLASGQLADWAASLAAGESLGDLVGRGAGQLTEDAAAELLSGVPGGALLSSVAGKTAKRAASQGVQQAVRDRLRAGARFATACELAVHLHHQHSTRPDYPQALSAVFQVYPEVQQQHAACLAAAGVSAPTTAPADLSAQLQQLQQLHAAGALTDDEFAKAKARLLAQ